MDVIGHQAKSVNPVAKADYSLGQEVIEDLAVAGGEEHILAGIAAKQDVIEAPGKVKTGFASHGENIGEIGLSCNIPSLTQLHTGDRND
jgi:hypothetical protein